MGDELNSVRMELVIASAAAGLPAPIEGVTLQVKDFDILAQDVARARRLGFGGKLCIHPSQVDAMNDGFSPSESELDRARRVLVAASLLGAVVVDGKLVDKPMLDRAKRLLAAAV